MPQDVKHALAMEGPVIVDVSVITDEMRAPRLQPYQKPDGSIVSKPLENLLPFLPREEFLANMIVKPREEWLTSREKSMQHIRPYQIFTLIEAP